MKRATYVLLPLPFVVAAYYLGWNAGYSSAVIQTSCAMMGQRLRDMAEIGKQLGTPASEQRGKGQRV